jgi:8-oxo-dGTP diphosphatase
MIQAAGGVVWRATDPSSIEVLIVHRRRKADWSLPKGKRRPGETALGCALREVWEETGLRCIPGRELPDARYRNRKGRAKRVRYWAMQEESGAFEPNREVDDVRWIPLQEAAHWLHQERDLTVVQALDVDRIASERS